MSYDKQILDKSIETLQISNGLSLDEITNIYNQLISKDDADIHKLNDAFEYVKKYHNLYLGVGINIEIGEDASKSSTSQLVDDEMDDTPNNQIVDIYKYIEEIQIKINDQVSIDNGDLSKNTQNKKDYKQNPIENDILWMIVIILTITVVLHILRHEFGLI